jgi:hypothetical protein
VEDEPPGLLHRRLLWLPSTAAFGLLVGVLVWVISSSQAGGLTIDWDTYAAAARRLLDGGQIYAPEQLQGPYAFVDVTYRGYVYPPPSVLLFVPFLVFGYPFWAAVNVALLLSGLVAAARREIGRHSPVALTLIPAGLLLCIPLYEGVGIGNVNVGIAGLFAWAWAIGRGRSPALGALLGLLKLAPGALVAWTDRTRFVRSVAAAAAVVALVGLTTLPIVGVQSWLDYAAAVGNAMPRCEMTNAGAVPVSCALASVAGPIGLRLAILLAAALAIGSVLVRGDLAAFGLVVAASVTPLAEMHLHVWLFPIVFLAIAGFRLLAWAERRRVPAPRLVTN